MVVTRLEKPRFRALSEEEFNRLSPEKKLAYLSDAFKAAVKSGDPTLNRRTPAWTPDPREPAQSRPKDK